MSDLELLEAEQVAGVSLVESLYTGFASSVVSRSRRTGGLKHRRRRRTPLDRLAEVPSPQCRRSREFLRACGEGSRKPARTDVTPRRLHAAPSRACGALCTRPPRPPFFTTLTTALHDSTPHISLAMPDHEDGRQRLLDGGNLVVSRVKSVWTGFVDFACRDNVLEVAVGLMCAGLPFSPAPSAGC
jgi:hypothetical protein